MDSLAKNYYSSDEDDATERKEVDDRSPAKERGGDRSGSKSYNQQKSHTYKEDHRERDRGKYDNKPDYRSDRGRERTDYNSSMTHSYKTSRKDYKNEDRREHHRSSGDMRNSKYNDSSKKRDYRDEDKHKKSVRDRSRSRERSRKDRDNHYSQNQKRNRRRSDSRSPPPRDRKDNFRNWENSSESNKTSREKSPRKISPMISPSRDSMLKPPPSMFGGSAHTGGLLPTPSTSSLPQSLATGASTSNPQLPSYYNPNVISATKYSEQVQKRKLIWGNKSAESSSSKWNSAKFSQDTDGKVQSKFMRLMGIKSGCSAEAPPEEVKETKTEQIKKREDMFSNMQQQYDVARQVTHTMRGFGLGFGSQSRQL